MRTAFLFLAALLITPVPPLAAQEKAADDEGPEEDLELISGIYVSITPTVVYLWQPKDQVGFGIGASVGYSEPRFSVGFQPALHYNNVPSFERFQPSLSNADTLWTDASSFSLSVGVNWLALPFAVFGEKLPEAPIVEFPTPIFAWPTCAVRCVRREGIYVSTIASRISVPGNDETGAESFGVTEMWLGAGLNTKPDYAVNVGLQLDFGFTDRLDRYFVDRPARLRSQVYIIAAFSRLVGAFGVLGFSQALDKDPRDLENGAGLMLDPPDESYGHAGISIDPIKLAKVLGI